MVVEALNRAGHKLLIRLGAGIIKKIFNLRLRAGNIKKIFNLRLIAGIIKKIFKFTAQSWNYKENIQIYGSELKL